MAEEKEREREQERETMDKTTLCYCTPNLHNVAEYLLVNNIEIVTLICQGY